MVGTLESRLSELYISNFGRITEGWPVYVNSRRREALETLTLSGIPGRRDEAYRHYDLRELFARALVLTDPTLCGGTENGLITLENAYPVIINNGFCRMDGIRTLEDGAVYGSLRAAANEMPDVVKKYLDSAIGKSADPVTALCSVFAEDGAFIYVPEGCRCRMPFHLDLRYNAGGEGEACFPRMLVVVENGASAEVIVTHSETGTGGIVTAHIKETVVGERARLDMTEAVSMHGDSVMVSGNYSVQGASSRTATTAVWLRGGAMRINAVSGLAGRDCESSLYGLYMGTDSELCDINMRVLHEVPDCRSYEVVKGIVSGEATGSFTGMVYVAPDAQRTSALQQSRNLQLSDTSRIFTEPQLEIYADDVKCSHGATVGQLNEEEVYYMRQRGISERDARKLQLQGFVNDVISHCAYGEACEAVSRLAEARIAEL